MYLLYLNIWRHILVIQKLFYIGIHHLMANYFFKSSKKRSIHRNKKAILVKYKENYQNQSLELQYEFFNIFWKQIIIE